MTEADALFRATPRTTAASVAVCDTADQAVFELSPDGRYVAVRRRPRVGGAGNADRESNAPPDRARRHADLAVFTPDNSQLFVGFRYTSSAQEAVPRLHVWDLTPGRELLMLPVIQDLDRYDAGKLPGQWRVLDGSPVKP